VAEAADLEAAEAAAAVAEDLEAAAARRHSAVRVAAGAVAPAHPHDQLSARHRPAAVARHPSAGHRIQVVVRIVLAAAGAITLRSSRQIGRVPAAAIDLPNFRRIGLARAAVA
jgi:hypothetical protein